MSRAKDKKIIDAYLRKHPNVDINKLKTYAEKKGIYIDVYEEIKHKKLKDEIIKELNLKNNATEEDIYEAIKSSSIEQQRKIIKLKEQYE